MITMQPNSHGLHLSVSFSWPSVTWTLFSCINSIWKLKKSRIRRTFFSQCLLGAPSALGPTFCCEKHNSTGTRQGPAHFTAHFNVVACPLQSKRAEQRRVLCYVLGVMVTPRRGGGAPKSSCAATARDVEGEPRRALSSDAWRRQCGRGRGGCVRSTRLRANRCVRPWVATKQLLWRLVGVCTLACLPSSPHACLPARRGH